MKKNILITFSFIIIGIVAFLIFSKMQFYSKHNNNINIIKQSTASIYQKKLLLEVKNYLKSNNIDLKEINDELNIDAEEIIDDLEFKNCSGNVIVKKNDDGYSYEANTKCDNHDGVNITYIVYNGTIDNIISLDNEVFISTFTDIENFKKKPYKENNNQDTDITNSSIYTESFDSNLLLTLYNNKGNIIWNTKIERDMNNNETSNYIDDIKKINDNYYIFIHSINSNDEDQYTEYLYKYDEKGNFISKEVINYNNFSLSTTEFKYIGKANNRYYYNIDNCIVLNYCILTLDENGYKINKFPVDYTYTDFKNYFIENNEDDVTEEEIKKEYEKLNTWSDDQLFDIFANVHNDKLVFNVSGNGIVKDNIYAMDNDYSMYYKNITDYAEEDEHDDEDIIYYLYKADLDGNLIKKVKVTDKNHNYNSTTNALHVSDNYIYITYFIDDGTSSAKEGTHDIIDKYDTDLNLIEHDINYLDMLGKDNVEFLEMAIYNNKLIIQLQEKDDYYTTYVLIINPDDNKLEKIYQTSGEDYENYGYVNSHMSILNNNLFEVHDSWDSYNYDNLENNEFLLAFYE
ncbi:MAG: hypothetical protein IJ068_03670 [Bacilli bacterium]|nr:hypothetical protein [Bacilli bacterium]